MPIDPASALTGGGFSLTQNARSRAATEAAFANEVASAFIVGGAGNSIGGALSSVAQIALLAGLGWLVFKLMRR